MQFGRAGVAPPDGWSPRTDAHCCSLLVSGSARALALRLVASDGITIFVDRVDQDFLDQLKVSIDDDSRLFHVMSLPVHALITRSCERSLGSDELLGILLMVIINRINVAACCQG
jgi:hypothetical protein